jgi:hypothetical protein
MTPPAVFEKVPPVTRAVRPDPIVIVPALLTLPLAGWLTVRSAPLTLTAPVALLVNVGLAPDWLTVKLPLVTLMVPLLAWLALTSRRSRQPVSRLTVP